MLVWVTKTENRGSRAGGETSEVHLECISLIGRRVVKTRGQMWDLEKEVEPDREHS